ncbi:major facilitator superfamily domain-containing protein [Podospora australis]|uniref:Major facilitator superfamily domain-containing protein n=1 Tax=Podospora australis TaxID=1536484 RepID=A0AAN6WLN3_9PEZI|nr:major facilitator superfamily domain-containing protein [Podospora australis]
MWAIWKWLKDFWVRYWFAGDVAHIRERARRDDLISNILDRIGFSFRVYLVAFLGFLASSWSLIAVAIITPALYFIYDRHGQIDRDAGLVLDMIILTSTILGMIAFGHLADRLGRSKLYGIEVIVMLAAIGGAAFSSAGFIIHQGQDDETGSLDIYAALFMFRFLLGLGIGAEYPMSAVIAAEFSPTGRRGVMLAAVFLAQSIGRILAYSISVGALRGLSRGLDPAAQDFLDQTKIVMDIFWRLALSLAGIPAIFALGFRLFIPETPRFFSAVKRDIKKARESLTMISARTPELVADVEHAIVAVVTGGSGSSLTEKRSWRKMAKEYYFSPTKGWKRLAAISIQWLLLDIVWYGVGLDSPGTLAALWLDQKPPLSDSGPQPPWNDDPAYPDATIVETIDRNLVRTLELSSIAALVGSIAVIPMVDRLSRKTHYLWTTWTLAVLFACMAIAISQTYAQSTHVVTMVFYVLAQVMFNLGPNTLTFILAAEIFPTEVRGTSYGIAAGFGKLGALIARGILKRAGKGQTGLVILLSVFSAVLVVMAVLVSWEPMGIAFPAVQKPRSLEWKQWSMLEKLINSKLDNKSLEEISPWPPSTHPSAGAGGTSGLVATAGDGTTRSSSVSEAEGQGPGEVHGGISLELVGHAGDTTILQVEELQNKGPSEPEISTVTRGIY